MSTFELVCLVTPIITTAHTGLVLVLCRLLNWLFIGVKPESQQMSFLIRIRIGVTHSTKCYQPVKHGCQPVVDCVETGTPQGVK